MSVFHQFHTVRDLKINLIYKKICQIEPVCQNWVKIEKSSFKQANKSVKTDCWTCFEGLRFLFYLKSPLKYRKFIKAGYFGLFNIIIFNFYAMKNLHSILTYFCTDKFHNKFCMLFYFSLVLTAWVCMYLLLQSINPILKANVRNKVPF